MNDLPRFSTESIFNLAQEGYLHELGLLVRLVKSEYFPVLLPMFADYEHRIGPGLARLIGDDYRQSLLGVEARHMDATVLAGGANWLLAGVNLAALCEIFAGWTIPVGELDADRTGEYLQMAISHGGDRVALGQNMAIRLNNGDAVRVVQMLKLLGLIDTDTSGYHQLSLGASIGKRDLHAFHVVPNICPAPSQHSLAAQPPLRFGVGVREPASAVLVDNDKNLMPVYASINAEGHGRIRAMNIDVYEGLSELSDIISRQQLRPRSLVTAFRLEPRGYPDVELFLRRLSTVIDDSADFIATIGSGDDAESFAARLALVHEVEQRLLAKGMRPVSIKCYQGDTPDEQRARPLFGLNQYASYVTLYCRLEKRLLE